MNYKLTVNREKDYLDIIIAGERTIENISSAAREAIESSKEHQIDELLIDVQGLTGRITVFESYSLFTRLFPELKKTVIYKKVALIDNPERYERSRFFNYLASHRGYNIRIFSSKEKALDWLRVSEKQPA
jgi:hypothetical protein